MIEMTPEMHASCVKAVTDGPIKYLNVAGVVPEVIEPNHVVFKLPFGDMHVNHIGIVYAGSYLCFAESAGATLLKCVYGNAYTPMLKSVNIDYLKPGTKDLVIDLSMSDEEASERIAYVNERGRGRYPMEIMVKDADGENVAKVDIVYYLIKK